jgi:protein-tyrosine-phosphatase
MKVLFVCRSNAERSQIAEALFRRLSKKNKVASAGLALTKEEIGWPPGRVVSELMLGAGYPGIMRQRRKQLTKRMAKGADLIIILLRKRERRKYVVGYLKRMNVRYWDVGYGPKAIYTSFPPPTYVYHVQWVSEIDSKVRRLVEEIG